MDNGLRDKLKEMWLKNWLTKTAPKPKLPRYINVARGPNRQMRRKSSAIARKLQHKENRKMVKASGMRVRIVKYGVGRRTEW